MAQNSEYAKPYNERSSTIGDAGDTAEIAIAAEANNSSGGIFNSNFKRHDDLREMLDSSKDNMKLDAMKMTIGLIAKGKDASELFPAVVKNVVNKNIEIKKLVYVYLVRYAEEQQDLALLSISTFQKGLKDPNQLIRASALRVLSSIRVPMIAPIMMLAIKEAVHDMSPYVRKTAAHAIPKLYCLDSELKEDLIQVIEELLKDKTTLVAGSCVMAFEEVCPDRIDLIHKNYRKLCTLLIDVEEWGQITIINMLTRYARTQFLSPNAQEVVYKEEDPRGFYEIDDDKSSSDSGEEERVPRKKHYVMDADLRLLLRNTKPLLQSRNSGVVMAVSQLYYYLAPKVEVGIVAKPLVRLLRSDREIQTVVLTNIATMCFNRRDMFDPYLKSFFIKSNDSTQIRLLKLDILVSLATETNISVILREFQAYVHSHDKQFAAATIQSIGRCASSISDVSEACLSGLLALMSSRDENVVAESVIVIKNLLQLQTQSPAGVVGHMARLLDKIKAPMARASICWLVGEYCEKVSKIAPDVLRKMAINFTQEDDITKLQIVTLACKLNLFDPKHCKLLSQYVLSLAKYDQSYDIRDRARFAKALVFPLETNLLTKHARKFFLSSKPAPILESKFKGRDYFQLGSLSHYLNLRAAGYQPLPEFPVEQPDPSVRVVNDPMFTEAVSRPADKVSDHRKKSTGFYSSSSEYTSSSESEAGSDVSSNEAGSKGRDVTESSSETEEHDKGDDSFDISSDSSEDLGVQRKGTVKSVQSKETSSTADDESTDDDETSSEEDTSEEESSEEEEVAPTTGVVSPRRAASLQSGKESPKNTPPVKVDRKKHKNPTADLLLLDYDSSEVVTSPPPTGQSAMLVPTLAADLEGLSLGKQSFEAVPATPVHVPNKTSQLLHRLKGHGLSASYRFTRGPCIFSPTMVAIEITLTNHESVAMEGVSMAAKNLQKGMKIHEFSPIDSLSPGQSVSLPIGIDFCDSTQPATFELTCGEHGHPTSISSPVGELIQAITMDTTAFSFHQSKLTGMNENSGKVVITDPSSIARKIIEVVNVKEVLGEDPNVWRFCGKTVSSATLVLLNVKLEGNAATITVHCEKMVINSMLLKDLKSVFQ